jgi:succinate-acetate transporter protein
MMVMSLFAVFWLSFGLLQLPTLGLAAAYSPTGNAAEGAASVEYNAVVGLYLIVWGFALFTFWIFTLKTNAVFAGIFFFVTLAAWVLAGAYFKVAGGKYEAAGRLQKVSFCGFLGIVFRVEDGCLHLFAWRGSRVECLESCFGRFEADCIPGWRSSALYCGYTGVSSADTVS